MKKSLVALAVLGAFAGGAAAQSSLTLYGIVDQGVSRLNNGQSYIGLTPDQVGRPDEWTIRSSTPSRLGFRGTEDLGSGLKANFQLEHRFAPDQGDVEGNNRFWHGSSWLGLSSQSLGEVRLGRDYTPAYYVSRAGDPWSYDYNVGGFRGFAQAGNRAGTPTSHRANNQLSYKTPSFGGFSAMASVSAREGGTGPNGRNAGANLIYEAGPLFAGIGFNDIDDVVDNRMGVVTVAYDFGVVRPSLMYAKARNPNNALAPTAPATGAIEGDAWVLGATAPLGSGVLKVGYGVLDNPAGTFVGADAAPAASLATTVETKKFGVGYQYNLSRRTSVHADVGVAKGDGLSRTHGFEVGVKHVF
ncbi:porin [Caldimonas tepidiphila]|uniref:porin n=1 Tax=Caldimonas tepidiphila TaxID=2315841 RepID=UPI000E5B36EF|nr:porin [Caldimonas tepidiphila]